MCVLNIQEKEEMIYDKVISEHTKFIIKYTDRTKYCDSVLCHIKWW